MRAITNSRPGDFSIGAVSKRSGVNIETIRNYERVKMLAPRCERPTVVAPMIQKTFVFSLSPVEPASWVFRSTKFVPCFVSEVPEKPLARGSHDRHTSSGRHSSKAP